MNEIFKLVATIETNGKTAVKDIKGVETQGSKTAQKLSSAFKKLGKVMKVAAIAGAAAATVAIIKMGKDGLGAFMKFEEGMNEVFTLLPGITEEAMGKMEEDVKSLAKEMGILPDEIVPALYQAISAGIPMENVFDFMEIASKAAIGGVTTLQVAVDGLTSVVNAFGKETITASQAADIMFTAVRLGKTNFEELSDRLFQVNPIAAALGVSFEDVAAAMAEITAAGVPTRVAATQLRQMFMELSKAGSDVANTFEEIAGKSFQDFIAEGHNLGEALQLLTDYAETNNIKMQDMFGSVEAGQAVLGLTGRHLDSYTAKIDEMAKSAGAADAAHATMEKGLKRHWDKIRAWWATVEINIGERLEEPVAHFLEFLDRNQDKIEDFVIGIFDKLLEAFEWIMDHGDMVATGIKAITYAIAALVAIKLGAWIVALGPIGGALLAAAVAVGGLRLAVTEFSDASRDAIEASRDFKTSLEKAEDPVKELSRLIQGATNDMGGMIVKLVETGKMSESVLFDMVDDMNELGEEVKKVPIEEAADAWIAGLDLILYEYGQMYPELLELREGYLGDLEASLGEEERMYRDASARILEQEKRFEADWAASHAAQRDETIETEKEITEFVRTTNEERRYSYRDWLEYMKHAGREAYGEIEEDTVAHLDEEKRLRDEARLAEIGSQLNYYTDLAEGAGRFVADRIMGEKEAEEGIAHYLKKGLHTFVDAVRAKLLAWAAAETAMSLMIGNLIGAAWIATQLVAGLAGIELISAGIESLQAGGMMTSPTLAVIGEGPYNEVALPLSPAVYAEMGAGIIGAIQGMEVSGGVESEGLRGLSLDRLEVNVAIEHAYMRDEEEVGNVSQLLAEKLAIEVRSLGLVTV